MILTWLALTGCEPLGPIPVEDDDEPIVTQSGLFIDDTTLDFGTVSVTELSGTGPTLSFTIINVGDEDRTVYNHTNVLGLDTNADIFSTDAEPFFDLQPGDDATIDITFQPFTDASYEGYLNINEEPELLVTLTGEGSAPRIELAASTPSSVSVGCPQTVPVTVSNVGSEELLIDGVSVSNEDDYTVLSAPTMLAPGKDDIIEVEFDPVYIINEETDYERTTDVIVDSNDPFKEQQTLQLEIVAEATTIAESNFVYYPGLAVDILIAVDNTGISSAHLQKADEAFQVLLETLQEANVDLNIALVTGGQSCPTTKLQYATSDTSTASIEEMLQAGLEGDSGANSKKLLTLAASALGQNSSGACLEGFLRDEALLHVVVISAQPDNSSLSIDEQLGSIWGAAPDALDLLISAIIATDEDGCPGASYGEGYADAAISTGGTIGDLCANSWAKHMEDIGWLSGSLASGGLTATLDHAPVAETIIVKVDGVTWDDWAWDAENNAVQFSAANAPDTGSKVQIRYLQAQECTE